MVRYVKEHYLTMAFGSLLGTALVFSAPALMDYGAEQYDQLRPVVRDWRVTEAFVNGQDVTLSGTMLKVRDCLLIPPPVARDDRGRPYAVETPMWRPKDALPIMQGWGPWTVLDGAGKRLRFSMVYLCSGARTTIVDVGSYEVKP